jgi:Domain of unknown function (DUF5060)/Domain of unknown function (DUF5605)/Protein of unknown function (DUF4038)
MKLTKFISIGLLLATLSLRAEQTVEQWGMFELVLNGPTNGNPFTDVKFSARFTQNSATVEANGFYDGDGVYRVRFMPQTQGEWHFVTESSSAELDGKSGDFLASQPSPENQGPVHVAYTYHFTYADGSPYEELGTTCYAWIHQPEALQEETLRTLANAPFNKLRMCVFPKYYQWNTNEPILYPFESKDGLATTTNWDFTRFNPQFFQHLDQRILDLQKLGIQADVILFHPYDGGHWGFDRMPPNADDRYLRYVVARLSAYRNVWWSMANEWDFMKEKKETDFVRFGEIISTNDPYHHLLSIHNGSLIFNDTLPWITHASIQNGSAVEDAGRAELYRDVYRKPVVYDEVKYEGNIESRWGQLSAEEMVFRFWNATVAGTYCGHGETYKSDDQVLWWSKGGVLKGQSPARLAFLKKVQDDMPPEGIDPIDRWQDPQDPRIGGQPGKYYLIYFGKDTPTSWRFQLPKPPLGKLQDGDGMKFKVEILDTWNMTITPVKGVFTLEKINNYYFGDKDGRSIRLPGKPYIALRIKRVDE